MKGEVGGAKDKKRETGREGGREGIIPYSSLSLSPSGSQPRASLAIETTGVGSCR